MKTILLTFIIIFSEVLNSFCIEPHHAGARPLALSGAFVSITDVWSTFHNQAAITGIGTVSGGIYYESRYMVDELSLAAGTFILPVSGGVFGLSFYQFGKGSFKEHKVGIAFAKQLTAKLQAAVQLDYLSQRLPENSRAKGFVTFEAGVIYSPVENLSLGTHIYNPVAGGIETAEGKQKSPVIFRFGGHYRFGEMVLMTIETQKENDYPFVLKTGIEFSPVQNLALRFGVSGKPVNYTAGIGYSFGNITTDIGFGYHGNLGITPSVSVNIKL